MTREKFNKGNYKEWLEEIHNIEINFKMISTFFQTFIMMKES